MRFDLQSIIFYPSIDSSRIRSLFLRGMEFYHDVKLGVVICVRCQTGMVPAGKVPFKNHLRAQPHHLIKKEFKATCEYLVSLRLNPPSQVPNPPSAGQPVEAIPHRRVYHGSYCLHCDGWRSINESKTRDHVRSSHRLRTGRHRQGYRSCLLQTIFNAPRLVRWFRIIIPNFGSSSLPVVAG